MSLIPEKLLGISPKGMSNKVIESKENQSTQNRELLPFETETKAPQDSSNNVESPHVIDPLVHRNLAMLKPHTSSLPLPPSSRVFKDEGETIMLTQDDFQSLKDKPYLDVDMGQAYHEITSTPFSIQRIARNYNEFVVAVLNGDAETVYSTAMIGAFDLKLNEVDSKGKSILHHVAETKCNESHSFDSIIEILVQKKADLSITDKENSRTPLHTAIVLRQTCLAKMFLQLGSPVNTLDSKGFSPLISAMNSRDPTLVRILLNAGANVERGIAYSEISKTTTEEIRQMLLEHRAKIISCLDDARSIALPQAIVSTFGTIPTSLHISPIGESDVIEYAFHLTVIQQPLNNYLLFECAVLEFDNRNETLCARMWQQSPIKKIIINGSEAINLHKTTNFITLPSLFEGTNSVKIELMNRVYKGTRICLASRLTHVFMAGFSRAKRLEPTTENLLPQMIMKNPFGSKTRATSGIRRSANEPRSKYFRNPVQPAFPFHQSSAQPPAKRMAMSYMSRLPMPPTISSSSLQYSYPLSASSHFPTRTSSSFNFDAEQHQSNRSPANPSSSTSSTLPPGFIPLNAFAQNGRSLTASSLVSVRTGANRPVFPPLSTSSNRITLKAPISSSATKVSSQSRPTEYATSSPPQTSTIPRLQRQ